VIEVLSSGRGPATALPLITTRCRLFLAFTGH
jgi:hypothetical protein